MPDPCGACAAAGTVGTCWQSITVHGGDGDRDAAGHIEMATGLEARPCAMCKSWEGADKRKVIEYALAKGLEIQPDGSFKTPIAKDFPGRVSLRLDPKNFGWCKRDAILSDAMATCGRWQPTIAVQDFQNRMRRG